MTTRDQFSELNNVGILEYDETEAIPLSMTTGVSPTMPGLTVTDREFATSYGAEVTNFATTAVDVISETNRPGTQPQTRPGSRNTTKQVANSVAVDDSELLVYAPTANPQTTNLVQFETTKSSRLNVEFSQGTVYTPTQQPENLETTRPFETAENQFAISEDEFQQYPTTPVMVTDRFTTQDSSVNEIEATTAYQVGEIDYANYANYDFRPQTTISSRTTDKQRAATTRENFLIDQITQAEQVIETTSETPYQATTGSKVNRVTNAETNMPTLAEPTVAVLPTQSDFLPPFEPTQTPNFNLPEPTTAKMEAILGEKTTQNPLEILPVTGVSPTTFKQITEQELATSQFDKLTSEMTRNPLEEEGTFVTTGFINNQEDIYETTRPTDTRKVLADEGYATSTSIQTNRPQNEDFDPTEFATTRPLTQNLLTANPLNQDGQFVAATELQMTAGNQATTASRNKFSTSQSANDRQIMTTSGHFGSTHLVLAANENREPVTNPDRVTTNRQEFQTQNPRLEATTNLPEKITESLSTTSTNFITATEPVEEIYASTSQPLEKYIAQTTAFMRDFEETPHTHAAPTSTTNGYQDHQHVTSTNPGFLEDETTAEILLQNATDIFIEETTGALFMDELNQPTVTDNAIRNFEETTGSLLEEFTQPAPGQFTDVFPPNLPTGTNLPILETEKVPTESLFEITEVTPLESLLQTEILSNEEAFGTTEGNFVNQPTEIAPTRGILQTEPQLIQETTRALDNFITSYPAETETSISYGTTRDYQTTGNRKQTTGTTRPTRNPETMPLFLQTAEGPVTNLNDLYENIANTMTQYTRDVRPTQPSMFPEVQTSGLFPDNLQPTENALFDVTPTMPVLLDSSTDALDNLLFTMDEQTNANQQTTNQMLLQETNPMFDNFQTSASPFNLQPAFQTQTNEFLPAITQPNNFAPTLNPINQNTALAFTRDNLQTGTTQDTFEDQTILDQHFGMHNTTEEPSFVNNLLEATQNPTQISLSIFDTTNNNNQELLQTLPSNFGQTTAQPFYPPDQPNNNFFESSTGTDLNMFGQTIIPPTDDNFEDFDGFPTTQANNLFQENENIIDTMNSFISVPATEFAPNNFETTAISEFLPLPTQSNANLLNTPAFNAATDENFLNEITATPPTLLQTGLGEAG